MGKTKRKWIETDWDNPGCLRAQDIPYDATRSIKTKIDEIVQGSVSVSGSLVQDTTTGIITLINDSDDPGSLKYYGTNEDNNKGFHSLPILTVQGSDSTSITNVTTLVFDENSGLTVSSITSNTAQVSLYSDKTSKAFAEFTNNDLVSSKFTFYHFLNQQHVLCDIYDDTNRTIVPDDIIFIDSTSLQIDLTTYSPISGTWHSLAVTGDSAVGAGSVRYIGNMSYYEATSSKNVVKNDYVLADTRSNGFTITLPISAASGDTIMILDVWGTFEQHSVTVNRNGHKINGLSENLVLDLNSKEYKLLYVNSSYGWKVIV